MNDYDASMVEDLSEQVPIKELLNCSVELYDLYRKEGKAVERRPTKFRNVNRMPSDTFNTCFPSHDFRLRNNTGILTSKQNEQEEATRQGKSSIERTFFRRDDPMIKANVEYDKVKMAILR